MSALYAACRMYCCCSGSHAFGHVVPQFFAMLPKPARGHSRLTVGAQKLDADEEEVDLSGLDDNQKMATIKALRHKPWLFLHKLPFHCTQGDEAWLLYNVHRCTWRRGKVVGVHEYVRLRFFGERASCFGQHLPSRVCVHFLNKSVLMMLFSEDAPSNACSEQK